jgi:hypothetical protein
VARPTSLGLKTAKLLQVWREGFWAACYHDVSLWRIKMCPVQATSFE